MNLLPNYLPNGICLNVLANSVRNAIDCYDAAEGHVVLGVLTKNYPSDEAAIEDMRKYQAEIDNAVSVGLGAGDPNQSSMVVRVSKAIQPQHVNQVFTGVGASREALGQSKTIINGLVSPTGRVGFVNLATGPLSSQTPATEVAIETAIALLKDMGGSSIKFFPMKGLAHIDEYKEVARACAANDFDLEPTGGIDLENFEEIVQIAVDADVKRIIPHVYSSIIDKATGDTRPEDVAKLYEIIKKF
ncbi:2-dehydro-3-deoxy-phosphogluconate aldolase [Companilactobacillus zhachilii]|uniref:2-dehydro-3-deoxy-phosphogluconate aldolase n=1 Tax=Companilactobacillus zhachilii TaxID=2304606 RepID=UPI004034C6CD